MAALSSFLLITASLFQPATTVWRLPCICPIVTERTDPIISPAIPSSHVHTIMGSNAFFPTMTSASTRLATCTVRRDFSTACIPHLYHRYPNGSFPSVPQPAAASICCLRRSRHGFTPNEPEGFPAGLSILAADPDVRASNDAPGLAISCVCLDCEGPAKEETGEDCPDGLLRARGFFPACCDGVALDLGEDSARVRRLVVGNGDGGCAGSQSLGVVGLLYGVGGMWCGETQLVGWDQGDLMGLGLRGDGWMGLDVGLLQRDVETCRCEGGAVFGVSGDALAGDCVVVSQVEEGVVGVLGALPGCNVVRGGLGEAVSGLGRGTGAGNRSVVSGTKTVGWSSEVVSSGVAGASSSGSMAALSSDPGSLTVLSSSPNHAEIPPSPTNSAHIEKPSVSSSTTTSDHPLSAAPSTTTSITISVTRICSLTITTSSASVSSVVIGPSTFTASTRSKHAHARRHAGLQGQQLYGDDLRLRKH